VGSPNGRRCRRFPRIARASYRRSSSRTLDSDRHNFVDDAPGHRAGAVCSRWNARSSTLGVACRPGLGVRVQCLRPPARLGDRFSIVGRAGCGAAVHAGLGRGGTQVRRRGGSATGTRPAGCRRRVRRATRRSPHHVRALHACRRENTRRGGLPSVFHRRFRVGHDGHGRARQGRSTAGEPLSVDSADAVLLDVASALGRALPERKRSC
jgi:hypothetical protein